MSLFKLVRQRDQKNKNNNLLLVFMGWRVERKTGSWHCCISALALFPSDLFKASCSEFCRQGNMLFWYLLWTEYKKNSVKKTEKKKHKTEKKSDFMSNFMQPESCGLCVCRSQGAAVLRMLSEFLTEPVFARGLSVRINPVININPITVWVAVCLGAGGVDVLWMLQIKPFIYFLLLTTDLVWCFLLLLKPPSFPMWKTNLFFTSFPPVLSEHICLWQHDLHRPVGSSPAGQLRLKTIFFLQLTEVVVFFVSSYNCFSPFCFPSQAVDNTPDIHIPCSVHDIMNRWTLQMGFPVVTIDTRTGRITQKHFLLDPDSVVERVSQFK